MATYHVPVQMGTYSNTAENLNFYWNWISWTSFTSVAALFFLTAVLYSSLRMCHNSYINTYTFMHTYTHTHKHRWTSRYFQLNSLILGHLVHVGVNLGPWQRAWIRSSYRCCQVALGRLPSACDHSSGPLLPKRAVDVLAAKPCFYILQSILGKRSQVWKHLNWLLYSAFEVPDPALSFPQRSLMDPYNSQVRCRHYH